MLNVNKLLPVSILLLFFSLCLEAQAPLPREVEVDYAEKFSQTIQAEQLRRHLSILSADDMEGRETGQPGQKKAAKYIADYFTYLGLPAIGENNGYYQSIAFVAEKWEAIGLSVNDNKLRHLREFYSLPSVNEERAEVNINEITFLGYGISDDKYDDYAGADLSGKSIIILSGEPVTAEGDYIISGGEESSEWSKDFNKKLLLAKEKGVVNVFIIDAQFKDNAVNVRRRLLNRRLQMATQVTPAGTLANSIFISPETAKKIMGKAYKKVVKARKKIEKSSQAKSLTFNTNLVLNQVPTVRRLDGENVLGFVEGSDPELKDEIVVVTAHYDHIGSRGDNVFNGADDNASGTSTVLEVAEAFVTAEKSGQGPRRSVLLMLVSGEEKGLLGSKYYVENPIFPLENTVVDINVDMVGRVDQKHEGNPNYIYVIGSDRLSTELHEINEAVNEQYTKLELDYTYNDEKDPNRYYYRSDHYNFAVNGIPSIFYFNGTHADYHRATDTFDKINFEKMEAIARLVFHTAWEIANRDKRIEVDVVQKP